jgi:DNA-binding CsgD family transcriptional regulator
MSREALYVPSFRPPISRLTQRETEVLSRTSRGGTNAQIADELGITVHAVKFHLGSIFRKLEVQNRTEAAAVYIETMAESSG